MYFFFEFIIKSQKLPAMALAWENLLEVFIMLVVSSFCCSSFVDGLHSHFLFDIILHPSVDYRQDFRPILYFQLSHRRVIRDTIIFNHSVIFLPRALRFWVGVFYPQAFLPYAPSQHFWHNLLFLEIFRASYWSSKHRSAHLLV